MAYQRHNWVTGEVITADKLNNIEDALSERCSFIKVMEATVTFQQGVSLWGCGGALTDNKTFGELVGDKTVIGFEVLPTEGTVAGTPNFYSCVANISGKNPVLSQSDEDVRNASGMTAYIHRVNATDAYTCKIEVYAVCI